MIFYDAKEDERLEQYKMDGERKLSELKKLSFREKIQYCWDYYKWVLVVIVIVAFSVGIAWNIRYNMQQETVLSIAVPDIVQHTMGIELEDSLIEYTGELADKERIDIIPVPSVSESAEGISMQASLQLTTIIAAGQLDILIGGQVYYESYSNQNAFYSMEELLGAEVFTQYQELISLKGDALMLTSVNLPAVWGVAEGEVLYVGILTNTPRIDMAAHFVRGMLGAD